MRKRFRAMPVFPDTANMQRAKGLRSFLKKAIDPVVSAVRQLPRLGPPRKIRQPASPGDILLRQLQVPRQQRLCHGQRAAAVADAVQRLDAKAAVVIEHAQGRRRAAEQVGRAAWIVPFPAADIPRWWRGWPIRITQTMNAKQANASLSGRRFEPGCTSNLSPPLPSGTAGGSRCAGPVCRC